MDQQKSIIDVENLVVDYGKGKDKTRAVSGISLSVAKGETVGFIGANGAGKSTTIKTLMGFIFPTSGTVRMFGAPCGTVESRRRIGYLPEVALYYPFMKARELLELYGGLQGMAARELKREIPGLLDKVGLAVKEEVLLKNFSKGMQQRLGIAQAIIARPEALVFDELSSGLDPVGRHDLRQVLLELKQEGRTIFFSSHELTEVETLCDRVIMIHRGKIVTEAPVDELMKPLNEFEIVFQLPEGEEMPPAIAETSPERDGNRFRARIHDVEHYSRCIHELSERRAPIHHTSSKSRSLEDYFIELVREQETGTLQHSSSE